MLAITGASAALALSGIPFTKTIAGVRVGLVDGEYVINPTYEQRRQSRLDLIVAGTKDAIVMVEAGAKEVSEEEIVQALERAHAAIREIVAGIDALAPRRRQEEDRAPAQADRARVLPRGRGEGLPAARRSDAHQGQARELRQRSTRCSPDLVASIPDGEIERRSDAKAIFKELKEKVMRDEALERGKRLDGRAFDEIRPISIEVGVLPRTHGSAVFQRGETQALVTATLGTADDQQKVETVDGETWKRFMLHYNFPPFSVGEVQFLRGPGRREIGHGALAERALAPMIPGEDKFPYTIRVVSDILESNGSSSMASVCGGSLAMMDAGVPLKAPVAGVAMGLIMDEETGKYAVLTDIAGAEDHYGDMDFKVAGSRTASPRCRWTSRSRGITMDIMRKALEQARTGRMHILEKMQQTLSVARENVSAHAPRIVTIRIPVDKIRDVIGPGGKMIRSIIERTGVKIDVEDDGRVNVASADEASAQKAIGIIQELTATPELNKTYMGKVQRITDFGAFVEIMPGLDGLLHVSEIAHYRVKDVRDELKEGEQVMVKVINIDPSGKIRLSRKVLIDPPEGGVPPSGEGGPREGGERPRREGGRHDGGRGGFRGDRDRDRGGDRGPRGGHDRRPEGGHDRRPLPDNTSAEVSGAARSDEPSGGEKD